jgi:hypothetical protein
LYSSPQTKTAGACEFVCIRKILGQVMVHWNKKKKKLLIIKASGEPLHDITLLYKHMKDMVSRNLKE